jgi:branched-chain amino acid transport system ATP-binding protein
MERNILEIKNLVVSYGKKEVLHRISFSLERGTISALLGPNGAGKSTTLNSIFGLLKIKEGQALFNGQEISKQGPASNTKAGIGIVPQDQKIFTDLTVLENLEMGGYILKREDLRARIEQVYSIFPILSERTQQWGGSLSGGERQMLAIAMSLIPSPQLLLLDEPSLGLSPLFVQKVMDNIRLINEQFQTTILLVEQNVIEAVAISRKIFLLRLGVLIGEEESKNISSLEKFWQMF